MANWHIYTTETGDEGQGIMPGMQSAALVCPDADADADAKAHAKPLSDETATSNCGWKTGARGWIGWQATRLARVWLHACLEDPLV